VEHWIMDEKKINLDELTLGQVKDLLAQAAPMMDPGFDLRPLPGPDFSEPLPFKVGTAYFIRTVTYHLTGRVVGIQGGFIQLGEAAWIAESGRWADVVKDGFSDKSEIEPYPDGVPVFVAVAAITDAVKWQHDLPRVQS